jgi:hypothetical protein
VHHSLHHWIGCLVGILSLITLFRVFSANLPFHIQGPCHDPYLSCLPCTHRTIPLIGPLSPQACRTTQTLHSTFPRMLQLFATSYNLIWPVQCVWYASNMLWYTLIHFDMCSMPLNHFELLCTSLAATSMPQIPLGTFNMPPTHCNDMCWTHTLCLNAACSLFGLCAAPSWSRGYWNNKESLAFWYIGLCMFYSTSFLIYFDRFCSFTCHMFSSCLPHG